MIEWFFLVSQLLEQEGALKVTFSPSQFINFLASSVNFIINYLL